MAYGTNLNSKKLFGTIAGLAILAGLSWHQTRDNATGAGMEDLMTGTALDAPSGEAPGPDITSSPEIAAEQECESLETPDEDNRCEPVNGQASDRQSG